MATETLVWTALPNGFDDNGDLKVSAFIAPRLVPDADEILKPFRDFVAWPEAVLDAKFTITYGSQAVTIPGSQVTGPARIDNTIDVPDMATWKALVNEQTPVSGFVFKDMSTKSVLSYDTVALDEAAQKLYTGMMKLASESLPTVADILDEPHWQQLIDAVSTLDRHFGDERTGLRDPDRAFTLFRGNKLKFQDALTTVLAQAQLFHTPPAKPSSQNYKSAGLPADDPRLKSNTTWLTYNQTPLPKPTDFSKIIDFHQIVAAMSSYPRLLRRTAIVVDFIVPRDAFALAADRPLSVECDLGSAPAGVARTSTSNATHTRLTAKQFQAVSRPSPAPDDLRVVDGLLDLSPNQFAVLQADVDATGLKLMNFARTLGRMVGDPHRQVDAVTKFDKEAGAPALRNAGFMLVHRNRATMLSSTFAGSLQKDNKLKAHNANPTVAPAPDLFAEDVVRGWRVDVWDDKSSKWHSLFERFSTHTIGPVTVDDDREGMLRLATTQSSDGNNPDVLYLHEAFLTWAGWSLAAPQPGQTIGPDDTITNPEAEVPPGMPMTSMFLAKAGTLPRLRYGRSYKLRARATDLAANSLAPTEQDFSAAHLATRVQQYWRFEPLMPPSLALVTDGVNVEKPFEGETMDRLAIRTFNVTPADNVIPSTQIARRFGVEARSTVREAEFHGFLDANGQVNGDASIWQMLADKDKALAEVQLLTPGPLADSAAVETTYAVLQTPGKDIPYLPDPLCTDIAARLLHHPDIPATTLVNIPAYVHGDRWPNASPFLIRIVEDATQPFAFEPGTRILQIPMPKAARVTLLLSCRLTDPTLMGVWQWLPAADKDAIALAARRGRHWALTPWRTVELVHAVQKPLIAPEMKFSLNRGLGDTFAIPRFSSTCSLASTVRVDLQAAWHEPDDDPSSAASGADRARVDHAFSVKITDPQSYASKQQNPSAQGFAEHLISGPDMITVNENRDLSPTKLHEFNDTRYRRIEYWLEATSRFREYMPASVLTKTVGPSTVETDENIKVQGKTWTTWIPNSAPPPAPKVLYVMPTFGWSQSVDTSGKQTRWRRGGGLRVYLDRPWNASGYGEMLGVVLPRANFTGDPNTDPPNKPYKKFVTQWGMDPIWESAAVAGPTPKPSNFPLARTQPDPSGGWLPAFAPATEADQPPGPFAVTNLPHPAVSLSDSASIVDVAPHDVVYDPERRLWYCDIAINYGASYFPFVRLALARYQPTSVWGAALSNIVLADFMALAPDRWLTVSRSENPLVRNLTVFGHTYSDSSGHREASHAPSTNPPPIQGAKPENPVFVAPTSIVEVWVEKLDPQRGEDFGWIRDTAATATQIVAAPLGPITTGSAAAQTTQAMHAQIIRPRQAPGVTASTQLGANALQAGLASAQAGAVLQAGPVVLQPGLFAPVRWQGVVTLPPQPPGPAIRHRLVIAEYEEYIVDDLSPYNATPSAKGRRMVFVDHVEW